MEEEETHPTLLGVEAARWQRICELFDGALDLPMGERGAWLEKAAADDEEQIRVEVGRMLAAHEGDGGILDTRPKFAQSPADRLEDDTSERPTLPPVDRPVTGPISIVGLGGMPLHVLEGSVLEGRIGPYRLIEEIGQGSMGVVHRAYDTRLSRDVAIKVLPNEMRSKGQSEERFLNEARAASALDHPNICTIYDIGETSDGQLFLAMAYYPGETLQKRIVKGPMPIKEVVKITRSILAGLDCSHEAGIIHRDIKPENVIFTERDQVKILDFGVAKLESSDLAHKLTATGTLVGTLAYMAPEQLRGERCGPQTDLWALGIVLYEMLVSRLPFIGQNPFILIHSVLNEKPRPLRELRPDIPEKLEQLVDQALAKSADQRPESARVLAEEMSSL